MAGISLSGLASGMDWKSIVTQLMALERTPQDKAKAKVASLASKQTALDSIKTSLLAVQTAAKALNLNTGSSKPRTASVLGANPDASVTTSDGAAAGTFQVSVGGAALSGMPSSSVWYGRKNALNNSNGGQAALRALTLADYGVTPGTVTINGTQITISDSDVSKTVADFFAVSDTTTASSTINGTTIANGPDLMEITQDGITGELTIATPPTSQPPSVGSPGDTSNLLSAMGFTKISINPPSASPQILTATQSIPSKVLEKLKVSDLSLNAEYVSPLAASETLVLNGVNVGTFDTSTTTVGNIVSAINQNSSVGVSASIDPVSQRVVLTSTVTGRTGIAFDANQSLARVLGLVSNAGSSGVVEVNTSDVSNQNNAAFVRGQAMEFNLKYNGKPVTDSSGNAVLTSDTNVVDLSRYGFGGTKITISPSLDVSSQNTAQSYTAVVAPAASQLRTKVETLIAAYNSFRQLVYDNTKITVDATGKVTTSVLSDNKDVARLADDIRKKLFATVTDTTNSSLSTTYNSISRIGLSFDRTGVLSISNSSAFDDALANAPAAIDALLNASGISSGNSSTDEVTQGVAIRVSKYTDLLTGTSGLFPSSSATISSQTKKLQKQIEDLGRKLDAKQKSLEKNFIAMEKAQSKFQSQSTQLSQAFFNNSSK